MTDLSRPIEQGVPRVEKPAVPRPTEPPKEVQPLGAAEQQIVNRIDKDGDEDKVLRDIVNGEPQQAAPTQRAEDRLASVGKYIKAWEAASTKVSET